MLSNLTPINCNLLNKLKSIQSYGFLLIVLKDTLDIIGFSDNIKDLLQLSSNEEIYNIKNILNIIQSKQSFIQSLSSLNELKITNIILQIQNNDFYSSMYTSNNYIIIELEQKKQEHLIENYQYSIDTLSEMYSHDIIDYNNDLLKHIAKLTDYDRIILYQFGDDWTGEVISEIKKKEDIPSFLNYHFPESDIPQYVRGTFLKNNKRYIQNINDKEIPIIFNHNHNVNPNYYGANQNNSGINANDYSGTNANDYSGTNANDYSGTNANDYSGNDIIIDTSMSSLNSISNTHKMYMSYLNVHSSYTCALIVNNQLWGLVICHNINVKSIPKIKRMTCLKLIESFSHKLELQIKKKQQSFHRYISNLYNMSNYFNNTNTYDLKQKYEYMITSLKQYLKADIVISNYNTSYYTFKNDSLLLPQSNIEYICKLINETKLQQLFISNHLKNELFTYQQFDDCFFHSLIYIQLKQNIWIAFFKIKKIENTIWAGNPKELIVENNLIYPRTNFSIFKRETNTTEKWNIDYDDLSNIYELLQNMIYRINGNDNKKFILKHNNIEEIRQNSLINLVHDLRSPIFSFMGLFDMLNNNLIEDDLNKDELKLLIHDGMKLTHTLRDLTTNMIELTKNNNGFSTIKYKQLNINELLHDIYDIYKYTINSQVQLKIDIHPSIQTNLIGDDFKIKQIVSNLISNACKYTYKGTISITANQLNKIENTCWIEIIIKDTGIGISSEKQCHIFKQFQQLNNIQYYSSGLGLSICYKLINIINGSISFESCINKGTTFTCIFPLISN
jgi:two-component system, chemotaxis family, sensor kinase Cph1